jgi:hypothetical protein
VLLSNEEKNLSIKKYSNQNLNNNLIKTNTNNNTNTITITNNNNNLNEKDNRNINTYNITENENQEKDKDTTYYNNSYYIVYMCKMKIIIRIFMGILLFDQLFANLLIKNSLITEFTFRIILIPLLIIIDLILSVKCMKYHCMNYLLGNYFIIVESVNDSNKINGDFLRAHCLNTNKNFWDFLSGMFINSFLPSLIYFSFINRTEIIFKLKTNENISLNNFNFFTSFLETILFITYSGFILSRSIVPLCSFIYAQIFNKNSKVKLI